eukprot:c6041_g1_i1.p1 GENE.c6041_g1_i1~~c6041_g1_i1.p1  ORF type:complete len:176 (+),score=37.51 c6041_g1_i1:34-528(+)
MSRAITLVLSALVAVYSFDRFSLIPERLSGCASHSLNTESEWYYGEKAISGGGVSVTFKYAATFNNAGEMFLCNQVTGNFHPCGPFNCSNQFTFDAEACALNITVSACTESVAKSCTDMHPAGVVYDSAQDSVNITFTSHFTGGVIALSPLGSAPLPIVCPAPQ